MKKLVLGLSVLLSTIATNSLASSNVCVPQFNGGVIFGVAGLYWRSSNPFQEYATVRETAGSSYRTIDNDHDWGYRLTLGYAFPCTGNDVLLTYTDFNQSYRDNSPVAVRSSLGVDLGTVIGPATLTAIDLIDDGVLVSPTLPIEIFPEFVVSEVPLGDLGSFELTSARARNEHRVLDLDFGQHLAVGSHFHLRTFGGVRYARIEQKLDTTFAGSGVRVDTFAALEPIIAIVDETTILDILAITRTVTTDFTINEFIHQTSKVEGVGPRLGAEGEYSFGNGFGLVAGMSTALLVAEVNSSLHRHDDIAATTAIAFAADTVVDPTLVEGVTIVSGGASGTIESRDESFRGPDITRIMPNIDAKVGIDYRYRFCNASHSSLAIELGYMVSHYWDGCQRVTPPTVTTTNSTRRNTDVDYEGPYLELRVNI